MPLQASFFEDAPIYMPLQVSFFEDAPLAEFMYLVFTSMPGGVTVGLLLCPLSVGH